MDRVMSVTHKGKTIIVVDVSNTQSSQGIPILNDAYKLISTKPPKSVLVLMDVTNAVYNTESANALKQFAKNNTPYIKASASVGAKGLRLLLHQAAAVFAGREIKAYVTHAEAMDWLVSHA